MLKFGERPPMTLEELRDACRMLQEQDRQEVEYVLADRLDEAQSVFAGRWRQVQTQLRDAVARIRAGHRNVDAAGYSRPFQGYDVSIERDVEEAWTRPTPLEREQALDRLRWRLLDELSLDQPFGLPTILAFALQLKMLIRWVELEEETGRKRLETLITTNLKNEGSLTEIMNEEAPV
jgi:hypothetical protein